jgi:hypothetical protein
VVVILDQFERVLTASRQAGAGVDHAADCLGDLLGMKRDNLTLVCVSTENTELAYAMLPLTDQVDHLRLRDVDAGQLQSILARLCSEAGIQFPPEVIAAIINEYVRGLELGQRFSLAHVNAVCHLLCDRPRPDLETFRTVLRDERARLDLAINRSDILNFIEDFSNEDERALLRDIIRVVSHPECNEKIVNYVRKHASERRHHPGRAAAVR